MRQWSKNGSETNKVDIGMGKQRQKKFECVEITIEPIGKRVIEHGAMAHFNCVQTIRGVLGESSLLLLPNREER
jgi:hypothetical protein